jgi:hypothetical protein
MPLSYGLLKTGFEVAQRFPLIKLGFDRFYGADCFTRWGRQLQANALDAMSNLLPSTVKKADDNIRTKGDLADASLIHDDKEADEEDDPTKMGELKVIEHAAITEHTSLDVDDRAKLLRDTVLIKDKRDSHGPKTSIAYNVQVEQKLTNPSESGIYEVLERPGEFTRMLIISNPSSNKGKEDFCTVVRLGGEKSKAWLNAHRCALWADKDERRDGYDTWYKGLGDKSSLKKGGVYLAVGPRGEGTLPFEVREAYEDGNYRVDFKTHCSYNNRRPDGLPRTDYGEKSCCGDDYVSTWNAKLFIDPEDDKRGTQLRAIQGELRVPGSYKILKLKDPPPPPKKNDKYNLIPTTEADESAGSEDRPISPGKLEDIQLLFNEKTAAMKVYGDHHEVTIRTKLAGDQRLTHPRALVSLVRDHGLAEKQAREILAKAGEHGVANYRVKYASWVEKRGAPEDSYLLHGGPGSPPYPPPSFGIEMFGGRQAARATYPDESHTMVPELDSSMVDPSHRNMWQNYTHEDLQQSRGQAQQAAQEGQKEVFDTSMISGMLKSVRQDSLVDRYLGDLLKALDKLGRILFMFYWHQDEFEDRYGKQDLPELEDSLRNAFESLGDITLFLKEKTIEPNYEQGRAEPDVEEAARN